MTNTTSPWSIFTIRMLILAAWLGFSPGLLWGQWAQNYQPLPVESASLDSMCRVLEAAKVQRLSQINRTREKLLYQAVSDRDQLPIEKIKDKHILWNPALYTYLRGILVEVGRHHPEMQLANMRILLARYPSPNATAFGEGTIVLNIGLLPRLKNESQLAFVLCHELAHQLLAHSEKSIRRSVAMLESQAYKEEVKKISNTEYGARARALALIKNVRYDMTRHSRAAEAQADSMAIQLLRPTRYDVREALSCLAILDKIDEADSSDLGLSALFHCEAFPFQSKWLQIEESGFIYGSAHSEFEADSLKTHPDCTQRIANLVPAIATMESAQTAPAASNVFDLLQKTAVFELGRAHLWGQDAGKALYEGIRLLQAYPENVYAQGFIAVCLNQIYFAQKAHEQGKWLEMPHSEFPKQYNRLLNFLQNIRLSELAELVTCYLDPRIGELEHEQLLYAWWGNCKMRGDTQGQANARSRYLALFPKGDYVASLSE